MTIGLHTMSSIPRVHSSHEEIYQAAARRRAVGVSHKPGGSATMEECEAAFWEQFAACILDADRRGVLPAEAYGLAALDSPES
jgi:hypothetical protein